MIVLVTVSRNDQEGLLRTLRSVSKQKVQPLRHLIIDSSSQGLLASNSRIAAAFGCEWFWVPPNGPYGAMNHGISLLDYEAYVWFLNSGDELTSDYSVSIVERAIRQQSSVPRWILAKTVTVLENGAPGSESLGRQLDNLGAWGIRLALTWFPHPSTLIHSSVFREVGVFDEDYAVAADYDLALRAWMTVGQPLLLREPISRHYLGGLSTRRRLRGEIEGAISRLRIFGPSQLLFEVSVNILITLFRRLRAAFKQARITRIATWS